MGRYVESLAAQVGDRMGTAFVITSAIDAIGVRHELSGAGIYVQIRDVDNRRKVTTNAVDDAVARIIRQFTHEARDQRYTQEWREKCRAALPSLPILAA